MRVSVVQRWGGKGGGGLQFAVRLLLAIPPKEGKYLWVILRKRVATSPASSVSPWDHVFAALVALDCEDVLELLCPDSREFVGTVGGHAGNCWRSVQRI